MNNEKNGQEWDGRQTASQGLSENYARAETQFEWAEKRTRMADERTDGALERTVLASERTLGAWLRTGIAAMAAGLGIARLLSSVDLPWLARVIGAMLVSIGAIASVVGLWRYQRTANKLEREGMGSGPKWLVRVMALVLLISTALAVLLLVGPL